MSSWRKSIAMNKFELMLMNILNNVSSFCHSLNIKLVLENKIEEEHNEDEIKCQDFASKNNRLYPNVVRSIPIYQTRHFVQLLYINKLKNSFYWDERPSLHDHFVALFQNLSLLRVFNHSLFQPKAPTQTLSITLYHGTWKLDDAAHWHVNDLMYVTLNEAMFNYILFFFFLFMCVIYIYI